MLDFRYDTFLELCKTKSYTKAAKNLHVSQPTVSQHIHYLEDIYKGKLFLYDGKTLALTKRGEQLRRYTQKIAAESRFIQQRVLAADGPFQIFLGATCTMGEFVLPPILGRCMAEDESVGFSMTVEYKDILLQQLLDGEILLAYLDGDFDTAQYTGRFFTRERLLPVCGPGSPLAGRKVAMEELFSQKLILREVEIDNRTCLENALKERGLSVSQFAGVQEICNINAIKHLVEENIGITFLYESTVRRELEGGLLHTVEVEGFEAGQDFNLVYLRDTLHEDVILSVFERHREKLLQGK